MKSKHKLNKRGKFLLSILLLMCIFGILFFNRDKHEVEHKIEESENYHIKIDYPDIENKKENRKIANSIKKYIDDAKDEFIGAVKDLNQDIVYEFSLTNSMNEYEDITEVHLQVYSYTGGAHYIRDDKSYYYKTKTGEEVNLNFFLENEEALSKLSSLTYSYIMKYSEDNNLNFDSEIVKEGIIPKYENFTHFTFKSEGIEFLFPPYQVSCWADGEIRINISYRELQGIIKREYLKLTVEEPPKNVVEKNVRSLANFKDKKLIAFTFDDGPSNQPTNRLLDNLDRFDARVTFFVLGSRVNQYKDSLKRAYEQGNQIGSHTYSHLNLFKLSETDIRREIMNTNNEVKNVIGEEPQLLRPPYGNINAKIKELTNMYTVLWDIDPEDWKYKDAEKISNNIVENAHDGAIVLLHDIYETSIDGALLAMEKLKEEGYAFVTIDEMLDLKNIEPDKTKSYFKF